MLNLNNQYVVINGRDSRDFGIYVIDGNIFDFAVYRFFIFYDFIIVKEVGYQCNFVVFGTYFACKIIRAFVQNNYSFT